MCESCPSTEAGQSSFYDINIIIGTIRNNLTIVHHTINNFRNTKLTVVRWTIMYPPNYCLNKNVKNSPYSNGYFFSTYFFNMYTFLLSKVITKIDTVLQGGFRKIRPVSNIYNSGIIEYGTSFYDSPPCKKRKRPNKQPPFKDFYWSFADLKFRSLVRPFSLHLNRTVGTAP